MTNLLKKLCVALVGLPIVWACSSGSGTANPGGGGSIRIEDAPTAFGAAVCDNIGPCCQQAGLAYDPDSCKALYQALLSEWVDAVNSGKVKWDGVAAGACLEAAKTTIASCDLTSTSQPAACDQMLTGTVAAGGACQSDQECAGPDSEVDCDNNVCVVSKRGVAGDACKWTCTQDGSSTSCSGFGADTGASCFTNDGLYCDSEAQVCRPRIAEGGTGCGFDDEACVDNTYCNSDVCTALVAVGGACTSADECVMTAYCDLTGTGTCAPKKPIGSSCTSNFECSESECDAGVCKKDPASLGLICG